MASRFVSSGAIDAASGESVTRQEEEPDSGGGVVVGRNQDKWEVVQREIEEERKRREEARKKEVEGGEQSLYEVLQANKAAKQAAFEEQNRIRNQFRALDDDEVRFLEDVRDAKRAEEERVKRETEESLRAFHAAQRKGATETGNDEGDDPVGEFEDWEVGRKRKRSKEKVGIKGVRRKVEGTKKKEEEKGKTEEVKGQETKKAQETKTSPVAGKTKLGLVDYGSDSDE